MRLAVQRALTGAGYVVHTASDGETGIVAARETLPDLVLLDLVLPKTSGLDVLRALKHDAITKNIPVVVLATLSQPNREELLNEGVTACVGKVGHTIRKGFCSFDSHCRAGRGQSQTSGG